MNENVFTNRSRTSVQAKEIGKVGSLFRELKKNRYLYLMALPGIAFFLVFAYLPMAGVVVAFQNFKPVKGILGSEWVGLKNFEFFVQSPDVLKVVGNTLFLNVLFIAIGTSAAIAIAIALSEITGTWFKRIAQSIVILPYFLSWTVVAMFTIPFLSSDGLINQMVVRLGFEPIAFLQDASLWPAVLVLLKLWHGGGFGSIVYLATITGIPTELYEAASIDGATKWQQIRHITLPLLKNTAIVLVLLAIGGIFYGDFGMIYAIVGRNVALYPTTDVIDTYVFRMLMELGDISMAAAVGLFQSVVGFILVVTVNKLAKKVSPESAIF